MESGGDNLAAQYSRELADHTIYVIDVAGGDKVPRKGGPGITQSDLLVINKTDLAPHVGADLERMAREAAAMRGDGPTVLAQVVHGVGLDAILDDVLAAWRRAVPTTEPSHAVVTAPTPTPSSSAAATTASSPPATWPAPAAR